MSDVVLDIIALALLIYIVVFKFKPKEERTWISPSKEGSIEQDPPSL